MSVENQGHLHMLRCFTSFDRYYVRSIVLRWPEDIDLIENMLDRPKEITELQFCYRKSNIQEKILYN